MSYQQTNLQLLQQRWPAVVEQLRQFDGYSPQIELIDAEQQRSIRVDGVLLGSAYDRRSEAMLQRTFFFAGEADCWLYGVGLGDLPSELLRQPELQQLNVVLLAPQLFWRLLEFVDHSEWLKDPRVSLQIVDEASQVLQTPMATVATELTFVDPSIYPLRDRIRNELRSPLVRENYGESDHLNARLLENESRLATDPDVAQLFGSHVGSTVYITAAGPTLLDTIELLKARDPQSLIVAVDKSLETLLVNDVVPEYVVTLDGHDVVLTFFQGIDQPIDINRVNNSSLVYMPRVSPEVLDYWPGARYGALSWEPVYDELKSRVSRAELYTGGSVIHPAVDLAVKLGAKQVVLLGADFGYPEGVFSVYGRAAPEDDGGRGYTVANGHGEQIPSVLSFQGFLRDLEDYIAQHPSVRFFNTSREGAKIAGTDWWES